MIVRSAWIFGIRCKSMIKHETCLEHFHRRLREGWKCVGLEGYNAFLLSPDGNSKLEIDLRNDVDGPNSPGTVVDNAAVGTEIWSNPNNAKISDNIYTGIVVGGVATSHYLKATNFGFSIPVGATIDGILVEIEREADQNSADDNVKDSSVKIVKADGSIGATNKADTVNKWPTTDTYKSYGSAIDLWGESWTSTDINDVDFGVVLSVVLTCLDWGVAALVDHIRITVYYTPAATLQGKTANMVAKMIAAELI